MKKQFVSLFLTLLIGCGTFGAMPVYAEDVITMENYSSVTYGIEEILPPQYEDVTNMVDGIAAVQVNGKWGFINESGEYIIDPKYDFAEEMVDGAAVVGYIDTNTPSYTDKTTGEEVVFYNLYVVNADGTETPLKFDREQEYRIDAWADKMDKDGRVQVQRASNSTYQIMNYDGVIKVHNKYFYTSDGKPIHVQNVKNAFADYKFYNSGTSLDFYMLGRCVDGVIAAYAEISFLDVAPLCFWMDIEGNIIKVFDPYESNPSSGEKGNPGFLRVYAPEDGYAVALYADYDGHWGKEGGTYGWGITNAKGKFVVEPQYTNYYYMNCNMPISDGMSIFVDKDGNQGVVDTNGNVIIPFGVYDWISLVQNGFARVGFNDETGKISSTYLIDTNNTTYSIENIDGTIATIARSSMYIRENGVWRVVNEDNVAYLVMVEPINGVVPVIKGSEKLNIVGTSEDGKYVVSYRNDKYGFAKIINTTKNEDKLNLLKQYFAGHNVSIKNIDADMDNSGSVTRKDAMILARYLDGWKGYSVPYIID